MKLKLPHHRWLLLIGCLAAVAIGFDIWLQFSRPVGQYTRKQYDRIRLGMTPAELSRSMCSPPTDEQRILQLSRMSPRGAREWVVVESDERPLPHEKTEIWYDGSVLITVGYRNGKAVLKMMEGSGPPWGANAGEWLDWLRYTDAQ
jgi:hypothetical protein